MHDEGKQACGQTEKYQWIAEPAERSREHWLDGNTSHGVVWEDGISFVVQDRLLNSEVGLPQSLPGSVKTLSNRAESRNLIAGSSAEKIMSQSGLPSFKEKLVNRTVIVKVSLFTRPFSGTITAVDDTGFCLVSNDMNAALREVTAGAMANMDAPSVYLPFSQLEWLVSSLVTSQPKAAAASA